MHNTLSALRKTCIKRSLKKTEKSGFKTNYRLMQVEIKVLQNANNSAILLTFIKLPFVINFVLSILIQIIMCMYLLSVVSAIVGGQETTPNEYPWNIFLKRNGSYYCTGIIMSPSRVLTAAHCLRPHLRGR